MIIFKKERKIGIPMKTFMTLLRGDGHRFSVFFKSKYVFFNILQLRKQR